MAHQELFTKGVLNSNIKRFSRKKKALLQYLENEERKKITSVL